MKYHSKQYDRTACRGLHPIPTICPGVHEPRDHIGHAACSYRGERTSGGVCPAILPCNNDECTIRPLPGLGYNAAIVKATASLRNAWVGWPSTAVYIAADRFDQTNPRVACSNPATHDAFNHLMHSGTALSFLDRNFTVVKRTFVTGGKCAAGRFTKSLVKSARMVTDSRLIEMGSDGEIWLQHASHWPTGNCNGSWIAKLTHFAKYVCPQQGTELNPWPMRKRLKPPCKGAELHGYKQIKSAEGPYTVLQPTEYGGGVGLEFISHGNRTGRLAAMIQAQQSASSNPFLLFDTSGLHRLAAERNGGIVLSNDGTRQPLYELVNVAPELQLRAPSGQYTYHKLPPGFAKIGMHNSIHPIWLPELSEYLCVGHRHYGDGSDDKGEAKRNAHFRFGSSYRQIFFTLSPLDFSVRRFSREFCFPSLEKGSNACEGIQFVMSAFRPASTSRVPSVSFSYGVQDCESAVLTMTIAMLERLLEFR